MANGIELAKAYVQIVPSADGIQGSLEKAMGSASEAAGKEGGKGLASGLGSALGGVAKVAAAGLATATTAIGGFGVASVNAGKAFDKSMAQVAATMGVSVDEIGSLRDFAQEMGRTTAFSATEAADALNYMALAGYDSETAMSMLPTVLDLAAAGGIDLAYASDMVTDSQSALGLSLEDTSVMVDQMAKASSKSNTSVEQLGEAILTVGGNAKNLSGGTTELATALGIMADNGIKGSEAGTHLRNIMLALTPKSEDAAAAMESIGFNAYDADGNLRPLNDTFTDLANSLANMSTEKRTGVIATIFNKTDLAAVDALLSATTTDVDTISGALGNAGVSWDKYADKIWAADGVQQGLMDDLLDNIDGIKAGGDSAALVIDYLASEYDLTMEDATAAVTSVGTALSQQSDRWTELSGYIKEADGSAKAMSTTQLDNLAGDITLFQSALEGAKIAVSDSLTPSLREFVSFGTDGVSRLTEAFQNEGLTGAASVFGDILGEGIQMIVEKLPEFLEMGSELFKGIVDGVLAALPVLIENLPTMIDTFIEMVLDIAGAIIEALPEIIQQICDALPEILPKLIDGIVALFIMLCENFQEIIDPIIQALPDIINSLTDALIENLPQIIAGIIMLIAGIIAELPSILVGIWDTITHFFTEVWEEWIGPAFEEVGGFFSGIWDGIVEVFQGVATWFDENVITPVVDFFRGLWEDISGFFVSLWEDISGAFVGAATWFDENVIQPVVEFFRGVWESVSGFFQSLWDDIVYWFDQIIGPWIEIAKRAFTAFKEDVIDPLTQWFEDLWNGIKDAASAAWDWIVGIWNTVSTWFSENVIQPVKEFFTEAWDTISGAASSAWDAIVGVWNAVTGWFDENIIQPVTGWFSDMWGGISGAASDAWEGIKEAFGAVAEWFRGIFSEAWEKVRGVFSAGGEVFQGIKENIAEVFHTVVNHIIGGLNTVIAAPFNGINAAFDRLRGVSILGVSPFGWLPTLNVPQIPLLAEGGVLERGQMGLLEGNGAEAVVPLEKNTGWIRKVAFEMQQAGPDNYMDAADEIVDAIRSMKLYVDGRTLAGCIAGPMDQNLGSRALMAGRGVATA